MGKREEILKLALKRGQITSAQVAKTFGVSRQVAADYLRSLVSSGKLTKTGSTRAASYKPLRTPERETNLKPAKLRLVKKLNGLQEDRVFDEVELRLNLKRQLNKNALTITRYAFCEMLNNAIDHSGSERAQIEVNLEQGVFEFIIRDSGVGVFANVRKGFKLDDEFEAASHVFKGKQTTMPSHHSGQGIFFTSRIADRFELTSHKIRVVIDNTKDDLMISECKFQKGTQVRFNLKKRSRKLLKSVFDAFTDEDFDFNKNEVRVRLHAQQELMSRSQARRLLTGLEEFRKIIFDFKKIDGIGQAFADEVFRVFTNHHSEIEVTYENANDAVKFMIERVGT